MRNVFGWDYPPGAEHDSEAPYNQTDEPEGGEPQEPPSDEEIALLVDALFAEE